MKSFEAEIRERLDANRANAPLRDAAARFMELSTRPKYSYNFSWLGRPIIQYPQDIVAMQELIWITQPDLIIETGVAHGGSLVFYASMLELNAACGGPSDARVLGIEVDLRAHNRLAIEAHPMSRRINVIEGSSLSESVAEDVAAAARQTSTVLVCLDSNHTREHVLRELELYAPLTSIGSYCVVFDTIVDDLPPDMYPDRPWGPGNGPKAAVREFLAEHPEFEADLAMDSKLLISVAPSGYLRRARER